MIFEREKCIELCEIGKLKKSLGLYSEAIDLYRQAKCFDPTFSYLYKNTAKVQIGIKEYDNAFLNLLTYAHLNWINPIYNISQYEILLPYYIWNQNIDSNLRLQDNLVENICSQHPSLKYIAVDINLTFNAGMCYIMNHPAIMDFNHIDKILIENYELILLGKMPTGKDIRSTNFEVIFNLVGFAYIIKNLINNDNIDEIINVYFSDSFELIDI